MIIIIIIIISVGPCPLRSQIIRFFPERYIMWAKVSSSKSQKIKSVYYEFFVNFEEGLSGDHRHGNVKGLNLHANARPKLIAKL